MSSHQSTTVKQRIEELDLYRGFAILGIFMVNILVMNVSFAFREDWELEQTGTLNQITFFVLQTVFYSKFFAIFSFLFGIGVALQLQQSSKNIFFFLRRFGALFIFGVLHILFIWSGDILHVYGILGLLLLVFLKLPARYLLWSAVLLFLFPYFGSLFDWLLSVFSLDFSNSGIAILNREEIIDLKRNGSYWSGVVLRTHEYRYALQLIWAYIAPIALSMMLIGAYIVKKQFVFNLYAFALKIRLPILICTAILLVYRFTFLYYIMPNFEIQRGSLLSIAFWTFFQLSDVFISFFLLWTLTLLYQSHRIKRIISPFKNVGKLAFSNYILQSVFGYVLMRSFGLYETLSVFECFCIVLVFFAFQVLISKIYLMYFKTGPLERLWRIISYGRLKL
jgi:uncharacterized protein